MSAAPTMMATRASVSRRAMAPVRPTGAMNMRPSANGTNALHGAHEWAMCPM